jgi:MFS transporter, PPP family, 3-phenylpropionic acid transporter
MADAAAAERRRQLLPFAALSASYFAHIGFFNPYLPLWLKEQGLTLIAISLMTAVQSATRLFAPYGWGALSDHTGERVKLLRYSATVALVASTGLWFDGGLWWLALVLLVMFTHTSSMMPMSEAAMAHLVSRGGAFDARRYGRVRLWGSAGFLVTVFAAGAWFEAFGMRHFPAWTLLTLGAVVASVWWLPDLKEAVPPHAEKLPVGPVLRQPAVRWLFASIFFHVMSHIAIYAFFSLYLDALGYSKTTIGLMWAVSVVVEIGWFFTQGRWLPRMSLTAWLVLCAAATALRMGITASAASVMGWLLLAQMLHALTFATHHTVCIALLSHHFPGRLRGRGQALYTVIGYGFPGVLGATLGGALSTQLGLVSVFWAALLTGLVATGCAYRVWRLERPASA